jgi:hypothetical protein
MQKRELSAEVSSSKRGDIGRSEATEGGAFYDT